MSLTKELKERGFIHQSTTENLEEVFDRDKRAIYHGIDPSADSAHAGNLVQWVFLKHLADAGHKIIFLVGGATGMIGDPKPDAERTLLNPNEVEKNINSLKKQAENFFGDKEVEFVNNYDWFESIKLIDFLRDIGKHFTVNELIKRDAISKRLEGDTGLSYTEFAYPLIQGFDFLELYKNKNCTVQIGGSDQWGNIISGVDLVRRKEQVEVFAVTTPLVIDKATGKKFGKSEGNAVWLAPDKTSPYQFYQFWLNVSDENVIDYLKIFTFVDLEEINELKKQTKNNPGARVAQKRLAFEVTKLIHNENTATSVEKVSRIIFGEETNQSLNEEELDILYKNAPTLEVLEDSNIVDILVASDLAGSKREARTLIESGAVSLGGELLDSLEHQVLTKDIEADYKLLRKGKKSYCLLVGKNKTH